MFVKSYDIGTCTIVSGTVENRGHVLEFCKYHVPFLICLTSSGLEAAILDFPLSVTFDCNGSIASRSNEFAELENMRVFIEILTVSDLQAEILVVPV